MKIPHPIPYQGSKRNIADEILRFFPQDFDRLIEPFAGSAAISIAAASYFKASKFIINDINEPLINLWKAIVEEPEQMVKRYHEIWMNQAGQQEAYYYRIRELFNQTQRPEYLLFLLAKCVKAAVRYNANGEFNQSPDKRRNGRRPDNMRDDILKTSWLLKGKTQFFSKDYQAIFDLATPDDLVYLDPPYQGTGLSGGFRYYGDVQFDDFVLALLDLTRRNIPFILSYDGRTGDKEHGQPLPEALKLMKIEIDAGRSSTATLHNRVENTIESLYLSESLLSKIDIEQILFPQSKQPTLFD